MSDKIHIVNQQGQTVEALAPVIISASRSTDIPAFYSDWFINRLREGYVVWRNPFNQQPMFISFKNTKVVVFWTKNPEPLIPYLHELDERGIHYYFQITLNDYEKERFEPNVPKLSERIETFKLLSDKIGKEKTIWRFDPLILTSQLSPRELLNRIWHIGNQLKGYTEKLVFSFIDINAYRKVQNNLVKESLFFTKDSIMDSEPNKEQKNELAEGLAKLRDYWKNENWNLTLATCAEDIDLEMYGITHNRCIDGDLMERLFGEDKELVYYLHTGKLPEPTLFEDFPTIPSKKKDMKDKGQREICGCMVSKDIGQYNTCPHQCIYCYANSSKELVMKNWQKHLERPDAETITGV